MSIFEDAYKNLNSEQKLAVDTIQGPVMVIAGPGTGKTQVLTLRIANILNQTDALPQNILALTFTENAAANMKKRLATFIGAAAYKVKISTFHGFCNDIIASYPEKFSFRTDLEALDEFEAYQTIRGIIDEFDFLKSYDDFKDLIQSEDIYTPDPKLKLFTDPYFYQKEILGLIGKLKMEFISPDKFKEIILDEIDELNSIEKKFNPKTGKPTKKWGDKLKIIEKNIELLGIYKAYQNNLLENAKYDYNDMINFVVEALGKEDELLASLQEQYQYILVDEYQDTNGSQNEIIKLLGSFDDSPNIFIVGDDDQAIYKFQGANISNILEFKNIYQDAKIITITTNYRSTQAILDFAESIIKNNKQRLVNQISEINKNIISAYQSEQTKVKVLKFTREEIENYWIAKQIQELANNGTKLSEIAVIYRKHRDSQNLVEILERMQIKVTKALSSNLLEDIFISNLINILKVIDDPSNDGILAKALNFEFLNLRKLDVFKVIRYAFSKKLNLIDLLTDIQTLNLAGIEAMHIYNFGSKLVELKNISYNTSFLVFVQRVMMDMGVYAYLRNNKDYAKIISLNKLVNFIKKRNQNDREYSLSKFLTDLDIMQKSGISLSADTLELRSEAVNLLTAHSSKGLEFEYVFIPRFAEGNWSNIREVSKIKLVNRNLKDADEKIIKNEEERRLFFVATTRAKKSLFICHSDEYISGDMKTSKSNPAQFLAEIQKDVFEEPDNSKHEGNIEAILDLSVSEYEPFKFEQDEKEYLTELLKNFKLSATSLNKYIEDPKEFLYKYVLKVPEITTKEMALGSAIHNAIEFLNIKLKQGEQVPALQDLVGVFYSSLNKFVISKTEYEDITAEGEKILSAWYKFNADKFTAPLFAEYGFYGKNINLDGIPLEGKIDRIEFVSPELQSPAPSAQPSIRIIDYKSGSAKYKSQVIGPMRSKESGYYRQMLFYKILCELDSTLKYEVKEVRLEFLKPKDGKFKDLTIEFTTEEISEMKQLIKDVMNKIRNLEF
jgi:DNA helicase-2/ATP-dependent DNA helicase PcrA